MKKGYINNEDGEKHWYSQTMEKMKYFHSMDANTHILVFDKPMVDTDINKMMINNIVKRWYGVSDCKFKKETGTKSIFQKKGFCFQSENYKRIVIVIDYIVDGDFIIKVYHAQGIAPCK